MNRHQSDLPGAGEQRAPVADGVARDRAQRIETTHHATPADHLTKLHPPILSCPRRVGAARLQD